MTEKEFSELLKARLDKDLTGYSISIGEPLIYKVIITNEGKFHPDKPLEPKRGQLSFQTDVLIKKEHIPLTVIEAKYGGFSTHDVLTYSSKAIKHKEIYPYLRYGFVVGNSEVIENKFFTHNMGLDFAMAIKDVNNLTNFVRVVKEQLASAELLLNVLKDKHKTKIYTNVIRIENV